MDKITRNLSTQKIVYWTKQLVRIPSENPPGNEGPVAHFLAEEMRKLGFKVEVFDVKPARPNVVGILKGDGGGPTIMLNGHMDVVPVGDSSQWVHSPFEAVVENNRLYGRGAADMKGGIAAMLAAVDAIVNSEVKLHGSIVFAGVMDEETTGMGTQAIMDRGIRADVAVIGEPTNLEVEIAHKGSLWLEITTHGKAVHASTIKHGDPTRGVNAIAKMARIISELDKLLVTLERTSHPLVGNATVSVGTIAGGTKTNIVADTCSITVDRRLLPEDDWSKAYKQIEELIQKLREEDPLLYADLKLIMHREGAEVNPNEKIVKAALRAVGAVTGTTPTFKGCRATTDMSILMKQGGIPTVLLGPGNLEQAHIADEYIEIPKLTQAARIYTHILEDFLD